MKIAKIIIKRFRGIEDTTITPQNINVLLGHCGSGKTSTLKAIKWALTGNVSVEDIMAGEENAGVVLEFDDGTFISRTRTLEKGAVLVNGKDTTQKAANEFLEQKFNCSIDTLNAMCGSEFFETLSQKDLTAFILSILPIQVSLDKLVEFSEEQIGRKMDDKESSFIKETIKNTNQLITVDGVEVATLSCIETAYKQVFEDRKVKKQQVKMLEAKASFDESRLPKETKDDLNKAMGEINLLEAKARDYSKSLVAYEKSLKDKEEAETKLNTLKAQLKEFENLVKPEESIKTTALSERGQFEGAIRQADSIIATNKANIDLFNKTLTNLDKPICPISEKLICSTDKSGLKEELSGLVAANQKAIEDATSFKARCTEQVQKRDAIIDKYNNDVLLWTKKETIEKQIADFIIPKVLDKPEEYKSEDCEGKKKEISEKLGIIAEFEVSESFKAQYDKAKAEVELLEFACKVFEVKGVRSKLLEKALSPVESLINQKADTLRKGFKIALTGSSGLNIKVSPKGTEFVPMDKVSSGEFIFVAYLLMSVVNKVTGVNTLIIDNIDKLDNEAMKSFIELISEDKGYENIFIAGVDHDDTVSVIGNTTANVIKYPVE